MTDKSEKSSEWMFEDCPSLYNVKLAQTKIKTLEKHMFENCECLYEVTLPTTLKQIKEYAFENCLSLERITFAPNLEGSENTVQNGIVVISEHVEIIENYAFRNCKSIKEIHYSSSKTKISNLATVGTNIKLVDMQDEELIF